MPSLVSICVCWLTGLVAGALLPLGSARPWLALAVLATAGWLASRARPGWLTAPGLCLLAALAGVASAPTAIGDRGQPGDSAAPTLRRGLAVVEGTVESVRHGAGKVLSRILVERGHFLPDDVPIAAGTRIMIGPDPLPSSARVRLLVSLRPITPYRNPTPHPGWPSPDPAVAYGILAGASAVEILSQPDWARWLDATRAGLRTALQRSLGAEHAGLARALVLGEGAAVTPGQREVIRRAGLSHVLAVSGLHVAIVVGLLVGLLNTVLLRVTPIALRVETRRIAHGLGVPLALLLAVFAGGSPSALRAGATAALGFCLVACGKQPAAGPVAAGAILLITVAVPTLALRPGMLLSIAATAAILTANWGGLSGGLRQLGAISTRTMIATAPLVLWCFGSVALPGLVANIVLLPIASVLLIPLAAIHAVCVSFSWLPETVSAGAFGAVADAFMSACGLFASLDDGRPWPPPSVAQGLVLCGWAAAVLLMRSIRQRAVVTACAVLAIGVAEYRLVSTEQPRGILRVTFVDVGQGDAALIDLPDGRLMLIDAGGALGPGRDPGEHALLPLLRARRRDTIDIAVLSHPHPDHYGGLRALMAALPITELWDSGQADAEFDLSPTAEQAARLLREARARGTRVLGPADLCDRPIQAGNARIVLLWPCPGHDSGLDANDNSMVVRIDFGQRRFLFAGDIEGEAEAALLQRGAALAADVLKVPHHGSRTSSSAAFLTAVAPKLAVISAGAHNQFGHPHPSVIARLQQHGVHTIELGSSGGTIVTTDGHDLHAETWSGEHWSAP